MQQLTFSDYVQAVPGLFALNSNNFSQDLRISIRGFGARSAFGIRGIKILVDGIPETTPDGQGQIDNLALGSIASVEVIRGPSSLLYRECFWRGNQYSNKRCCRKKLHQAGIDTWKVWHGELAN